MEKRFILRRASVVAGALAILVTGGCAAVFGGMNQPVSVDARTADGQMIVGATCTLENAKGSWNVTTPGTLLIHRGYGVLSVSCQKAGQLVGTAAATSSARGWIWGNLLFGGIIGVGIDMGTGAGYDYPGAITVRSLNSDASFADGSDAAPANDYASVPEGSALPTVERSVASGVQTMVAAHADWDKICKTDGPAPAITLLDASQHGTVEIKQGQFVAPGDHPAAACENGKIYGTQLLYVSNAGFHGTDHIRYEVAAGSGRFTRAIDIVVN